MRIEFDPLNRDEATAVRLFLDAQNYGVGGIVVAGADMEIRPLEATNINSGELQQYTTDLTENVRAAIDGAIVETEETYDEEAPPEVDKNGVAWSADLHSTPAKINKDGTWRAKRGVTVAPPAPEPETPLAETAVTENAPAASAETTTSAPPAPSEAPKPPTLPANDPSPTPAPAPTPPVQPAGAPSFLDVMKAVTAAQKDGKISPAQVKELAGTVVDGASSVNDLNGPAKAEERVTFLALLAETVNG